MISSGANKQVKYVNALIKKARTRREEDLFVAEGLRLCMELPKERIHALYLSESFAKTPKAAELRKGARQVVMVSDEAFLALSDTKTPQGILALVRQYHYSMEDILPKDGRKPLILVLERIQDPGNLGTLLRAGEGAGVTGILMDKQTVDIYSPKVIRSTMGSVFRLPFVYAEDLERELMWLKGRGIKLFAAHYKGESPKPYYEEDYSGAAAFLIGNEAGGLTESVLSMADSRVYIPMLGKVESLNAAIAASVLMFEAARQRRTR